MYIVYHADGRKVRDQVLPGGRRGFTLQELQALVGGYIAITHIANDMIVVYNEEGQLMGLPHNEFASKAVGFTLCGTVLLCPEFMVQ